jgi:nitrous oxidase accessory protein
LKALLIEEFFVKLMSILLVVVSFSVSVGVGCAEIIYVGPGNSIQAAVNNSTTGDFVVVKAGEYQENVIVNVSGITIISEPDFSGGVLVRSLDENFSVFQLKADNVTIKGFNITGSEAASALWTRDGVGCTPAGICLEHANNCTIEGNNLSENRYGIYLQESMNNTLSQNNFSNNSIWLDEGCSQNKLLGNTIEKGDITVGAQCWNNTIFRNRLSNGGGISIACCGGNNLISANSITNCSTGIYIYDVQARTVLRDNRITDCNYGIYLIFVFDSGIYNNTISNSSTGIFLRENCQENELSNNTVIFSKESGIYLLEDISDNRIYNNYFNNTVNVRTEKSKGNSWNTKKTRRTNIVKGPYLGGNFWANPKGNGFSQTAKDSNSDWISDKDYRVNGSDFDYLPLVALSSMQGVGLCSSNLKT